MSDNYGVSARYLHCFPDAWPIRFIAILHLITLAIVVKIKKKQMREFVVLGYETYEAGLTYVHLTSLNIT
jgi:hypothetical protein